MIFSKFGKVYLSNLAFSANWECFRSIGNFFSQLGKNLVPETGPSFVQRKSPAIAVTPVVRVPVPVCVPVPVRVTLALKFSRSPYLDNHSSESIHTWTIDTL